MGIWGKQVDKMFVVIWNILGVSIESYKNKVMPSIETNALP